MQRVTRYVVDSIQVCYGVLYAFAVVVRLCVLGSHDRAAHEYERADFRHRYRTDIYAVFL